jgi:beta-lactamase regulating signal transducer with metallopeptidase domain
MSLSDPDEEYEELVTHKQSKLKLPKSLSKVKIFAIILIVGIILGVIVGHYYIEPLFEETSSVCESCLKTKELLTVENECLYDAIENPDEIIAQCSVS